VSIHPARLMVAAGTLLAGLSLLLTFASFPVIGPIDGIDGDAWPAVLPLLPVFALSVFGDRTLGHRPQVGVPALALACAAVVFAAAKAADASRAVGAAGEGAAVGLGTWALLLSCGVVAAGEVVALLLPPR